MMRPARTMKMYRTYGTHNAPEFWFACPVIMVDKIITLSKSIIFAPTIQLITLIQITN